MKLSFVETMSGSWREPSGAEHAVSFEVAASALGGGRFALRGVISAPPWAAAAEARGTLVIAPLAPALTYQLEFTGAGGAPLRLDAEKHPSLLAPVRSMTLMEARLGGAGGQELARGQMAFDLRDLPGFLLSWLPAPKGLQKRLEVRRRALARRGLQE